MGIGTHYKIYHCQCIDYSLLEHNVKIVYFTSHKSQKDLILRTCCRAISNLNYLLMFLRIDCRIKTKILPVSTLAFP